MRKDSLAVGLLLASSVVGCGAAEHEYVRPWFRTTRSAKHAIAPHAIEWGGVRRAEVLVDGSWRELEHVSFALHPVGDAIALDEYTFVDPHRRDPMNDERANGASGVFIYREGRASAIHIPHCKTPKYSESPAEIACFSCGTREPYTRLDHNFRDARCGTIHLDTYDTLGRAVSQRAFPSPIVKPAVEGRIPNGPWIFAEEDWRRDFVYARAPKMRFSLDASGFHALTFGADPLYAEIDAAGRAAATLREVPIRDAAVASLREAFAEDERVHPSWVVRDETVDHLSPGQAIAPEVPTQPGTCYTFVARASEGLTRLEVSIHTSNPSVPRTIEEVHEGVLAFATGAPAVSVRHCFAPGDPAVYHYRLGSRVGSGYVLARVYAHPPEN